MDRILPIDLERADLRKSLFGFAPKPTTTLLEGAAQSMQELLIENDRLRKELDLFRAEIGRMRAQEDTLKETLMAAQRAADETRAATQRSCDALIEEARVSAQQERQDAQNRLRDLQWECERLADDKRRFYDDFRHLLERYRRGIDQEPNLTLVHSEAAGA